MTKNPYADISRTTSPSPFLGERQKPLTPEMFLEWMDEWEQRDWMAPQTEFHHPDCPKLTDGNKACRCGMCPLEAIFEDELNRIKFH